MVEPVSLTLGVIAAGLVAKFAEKSADKAVGGVVDASGNALAKVAAWVRKRLGSSKELDLVVAAPDSASAVTKLGNVIDAEIVDEIELAELQALVDQVKVDAPHVYQSAVRSHHVVQASNSTVTVNWPDSPSASGSR